MRADLYAERKERAREVNERKAQKKASDATTKQLQLRSIIANAELAKCLFINERNRTQDHMDLPDWPEIAGSYPLLSESSDRKFTALPTCYLWHNPKLVAKRKDMVKRALNRSEKHTPLL